MSGIEGKGFSIPDAAGDPSEPAWIRDPMAAEVDVNFNVPGSIVEIIAAICEGEFTHCEYCGEKLPLWPPMEFGDHVISVHGPEVTILVRTNTSLMCSPELNVGQQMHFSMNFAARVSMRRRAWKLGYAVVKPGKVQIVQ